MTLKVIGWNFRLFIMMDKAIVPSASQRLLRNGNKRNAILWQCYDCVSTRLDGQDNAQWKSLIGLHCQKVGLTIDIILICHWHFSMSCEEQNIFLLYYFYKVLYWENQNELPQKSLCNVWVGLDSCAWLCMTHWSDSIRCVMHTATTNL